MFKRFKDRLTEVSEEVKKDPRFQNSLLSVNSIAEKTLTVIKNEQPNPESVSFSDLPQTPVTSPERTLHRRSHSSDFQHSKADNGELRVLTSSASNPDFLPDEAMNNNFFSLTEEDADNPVGPLPPSSSSRARKKSSSSTGSQDGAHNLFPIYEAPQQVYALPSNDLDSTAGSEWESDFDRPGSSASTHLTAISKEQLFQMLQKTRARYHKYKGRYADVAKAYKDLEGENGKVKNVMQQTQDKALRRISELKEQCQLEQKAKRHLEEELRSELEEKEHIIKALQTKVVLLKSGGTNVLDDNSAEDSSASGTDLIDLDNGGSSGVIKKDSEKVVVLEDKVRRLETLLTKCKESIKANKQKTNALTEVKDALSQQLSEKEAELNAVNESYSKVNVELEALRKREQEDELQIAQTKMHMHQEIIVKDEEIGKLRTSLKHASEEKVAADENIETLKQEIDHLKQSKDKVERSMEDEKASALQEMSRGKAGALQALQADMEKRIQELNEHHQEQMNQLKASLNDENQAKIAAMDKEVKRELALKDEEVGKIMEEKNEENRLALEEMELRLAALSTGDESKSKLLSDLELKLKQVSQEKQKLSDSLSSINKANQDSSNETKSKLIVVEQKLSESQATKEQLEKELSSLKENSAKAAAEAEAKAESLEAKLSELTSQKDELSEEIRALKITCAHETDNNTKQLQETSQKLESLTAERDAIAEELQALKSAKDKLQIEVENKAVLTQQIDQLKSQLEQQSSALKTAQTDNDSLNQELRLLRENAEGSQKELNELMANKLEAKETELTQSHEKVTALSNDLETKESELATCKKTIEELNSNLEAKEKSSKDVQAKLAVIGSAKKKLDSALKNKSNEIKSLNEKVSSKEQEMSELMSSHEEALSKLRDDLKSANHDSADFERKNKHQTESIERLTEKIRETEDHLKVKDEEMASLKSGLESKCQEVEDMLSRAQDDIKGLEDELSSVKNENFQLRSVKDLEEQMISYQKELQEQLKNSETREEALKVEVEQQQELLSKVETDFQEAKLSHEEEVSKLKADMDLKIRVERDLKETSFKDLQTQSIEYQKRLQDQLQEKDDKIEELQKSGKTRQDENKNLCSEQNRLQGQVEQLQATNTSLEGRLTTLESDLKAAQSDHHEKLNSLLQENTSLTHHLENTKSALLAKDEELSSLQLTKDKFEADFQRLSDEVKTEDRIKELQEQIEELKALENSVNAENCQTIEEMKSQYGSELESLKQSLYELQLALDGKASECDEAKSQLQDVNEMAENLRRDLTLSHEDKAAQLSEFEESLDQLERQLKDMKLKNETLQIDLDRIQGSRSTDSIEQEARDKMEQEFSDKIKSMGQDFERKLEENGEQHDEEVFMLKKAAENELSSVVSDFKRQVSSLKEELYEKTTLYEEVIERHHAELRAKQEEMDEEVEACSRIYTAKLNELQQKQQSDLSDVEGQSWHQEREDITDNPQDFKRTPTHQPAQLNVSETNHVNHGSLMPSYALEEATEFEYLKNILYQYMMGKQTLTLAKVLTTVVKFSPEETSKIIDHEEKKATLLGSILS